MERRQKLVSIFRGRRTTRTLVFALTFLILLFLVYAAVPKYSQPEYEVENYAEFSETLSRHSACVVPPATLFLNADPDYHIYLKTRFRFFNRITGYRAVFYNKDFEEPPGVVDCKQISAFPGVLLPIQPTETYKGIGIEVSRNSACFEIGDYRYTVDCGAGSREIAYVLIDARPVKAAAALRGLRPKERMVLPMQ